MTDAPPYEHIDASLDHIKDQVDLNRAIEIAEEGGVIDAEFRIRKFTESIPDLLDWLADNGRNYPWRQSTDPYVVYVTEILLQRTRADAVHEIFDNFFTRFPDPESLHHANEEEIRDTVRSLGFVNHRSRTLREVAELVCDEHGEEVPDDLDELKKPWRVGPYSARACQIFARGHSLGLVDSNFARVIERVLGYEMPKQPHKSDEVYALLDSLVPSEPDLAQAFNLAILDLGALVCTPFTPACSDCPLQECCYYYETLPENDSSAN